MSIKINAMSELGHYLGWKQKEVSVENQTIRTILIDLASQEQFQEKVYDPVEDALRAGVVILVNGRNILQLEYLDTILSENTDLTIYYPLGGG